jgi:hypothetical protein
MSDILGEKTALTQTKAILARIDMKGLSKAMRNDIIKRIYDNQLKKFTNYNRSQRHKCIKELTRSKDAK